MRLSNSGISVLETCEMQYYHRYVAKTEKDPQIDDTEKALRYGRIAHTMYEWFGKEDILCLGGMENCLKNLSVHHEYKDFPEWDDNDVLGRLGATYLWLRDWFTVQKEKYGMHVLKTEVRVENDFMVMIADSLITWKATPWLWFMPDFKTSGLPFGSSQDLEPKKIAKDPQLLLYAAMADEFAKAAGLDSRYKFGECIGKIQVIKPKQKMTKADPNWQSLANRIYEKTETKDAIRIVMVPPEKCLDKDEFVENHAKQYHRALTLHRWDGDHRSASAPRKNFSICGGMYGAPCPYWSQCHDGLMADEDSGNIVPTCEDIGAYLSDMICPL